MAIRASRDTGPFLYLIYFFEGPMEALDIILRIIQIAATLAVPFLVADRVYTKWFNQKGSEVIANEAKNVIIKLNEISKKNKKIHTIAMNGINKENYGEKLDHVREFYDEVTDIYKQIEFLNDCINANNPKKQMQLLDISAFHLRDPIGVIESLVFNYCDKAFLTKKHSEPYNFITHRIEVVKSIKAESDQLEYRIKEIKKVLIKYAVYNG